MRTAVRRARKDVLPLLGLVALSMLLGSPLLAGRLPPVVSEAYGDEVRFLGFFRIVAQWWSEGSFPLWNASFGYGIPLAGDVRSFCFVPFSWGAAVLPAERAFSLLFSLGFPWAAAGMYLFLRAMRLSRTSAFLGGWLFGCTGWSWIRFYIGHLDFIFCYGSIPWVLAGLREAFESRRSARFLLSVPGWAMIVAVGRPEVMLIAAYLTVLFCFAWSRPAEGLLRAAKRTGAAVALVGLLTFLVTFLPFASILDFVLGSGRFALGTHAGALEEMQRVQRIIPRTLLQLLLPRSLGDSPGPHYWGSPLNSACVWIGAIPLFLQCVLPLKARSWREDGLWSALALFGILIAFNDRLPVLDAARRFIPGFAFISGPPRLLFFLHMAVAVLSALALDRIRREPPGARAGRIAAGGISLLVLAAGAAFLLPAGSPESDARLVAATRLEFISWRGVAVALREMAIAGGMLAIAGFILARVKGTNRAASWVVVLAILECSWLLSPYWKFSTIEDYDRRAGDTGILRALKTDAGRGWVGAPYSAAWPAFYHGAPTLDGWHPFTAMDVVNLAEEFRARPERPSFRLLGIDHLIRDTAPGSAWTDAGRLRDSRILWSRPDRCGRIYLADRTIPPGSSWEESLSLMDELSEPPGALAGTAPWSASDTSPALLSVKSWGASRIVLEVRAPGPRFLVLGERSTAFRRFTVNGSEVPAERANLVACGVRVPGDCEVVISYRWPFWLLSVGLLAPFLALTATMFALRKGIFESLDRTLEWSP